MKSLFLSIFCVFSSSILIGQSIVEKEKHNSSTRVHAPFFGGDVEISGNYAIVSAFFDQYDNNQSNQLEGAGAAYIYEKQLNGNWIMKQKLLASDRSKNQHFGRFLAIDSNYAIVGVNQAYSMLNGSSQKTGAVYVFKNNNGVWTQSQKLTASDKQVNDNFGIAVDIYNDTLVIGDFSNSSNSQSYGAVYTFVLDSNGQWVEDSKLVSPNASLYMSFGASLALSKNSLAVGAPGDSYDQNGQNMISNSGAVEIYNKNNSGIWVFEERLVPNNRHTLTRYGSCIDIYEDRLIVGSQMEDILNSGGTLNLNTGAAYIYHRSNGSWSLKNKLTIPISSDNDYFGAAVGIHNDRAIVGAPYDGNGSTTSNFLDFSGSSFLFEFSSNNWNYTQTVLASDRDSSDYFGHGIAISENDMLIGAPGQKHDSTGLNPFNNAGMIYVFQNSNAIGINELGQNDIKVFPNPTRSLLNLEKLGGHYSVELFDLNGNILRSAHSDNEKAQIDLSDLPNGLYMLNLLFEDNFIVKKIVVQH